MRWTGAEKAAALLGLALGGFFDGILLHQLLGWHHLFSLVPGVVRQLMWDGAFHVAMYGVAAAALLWLWRRRGEAAALPGARLAAAALIGFAAWHAFDIVVDHWLLGLHRTRLGVAQPLAWDLLWLGLFAGGPLIVARRLRGAAARGPGVAAVLALATVGAGLWAARPAPQGRMVVAWFASPATAFRAAGANDARLVWADAATGVVALEMPEPGSGDRLYKAGAMLVAPAVATGCLGWAQREPGV